MEPTSHQAHRRTVFCPTGCHEDYLDREHFSQDNKSLTYYGTNYRCNRCGWEATWDNEDGMRVYSEADDLPWVDRWEPWEDEE